MKTHTSKRAIWLRSLLILPLLCALIYGFSTKEIIQKNAETTELTKEKTTEAEVAEYNKLAQKYNAVAIENRIIPLKDLKVLETIYREMNLAQRAKAQPFPECNQTQNYSIAEDNKKFSEAIYYYKGKLITFEKANELIKKNNNIGIYIDKSGSGAGTIHLYEEPFDIKKIVIEKPTPKPTSAKNNDSALSISRSDKTGFHFNTQPSTVTTLYYYEGNLIPFSKVHKLMNDNKNLKVYISNDTFGQSIVTLSETPIVDIKKVLTETKIAAPTNDNLYMAAEAPPAPNANIVEYLNELAKRGATFYLDNRKITADEAIELSKNNKDFNLDVSKYPYVILNGC